MASTPLSYALRILSVRDYSEKDVRRKLAAYAEKTGRAERMACSLPPAGDNPHDDIPDNAGRNHRGRNDGQARCQNDDHHPHRLGGVTDGTEFNAVGINGAAAFGPADIDAAVTYCKQQGWLDDLRFAQRYVRGRSQKGYGAQRITAELNQKGIGKDVISLTLNECNIDWFALARCVAERKCGRSLPSDWKEKAKLQRYLLARGFSYEEIQSVYANFSS